MVYKYCNLFEKIPIHCKSFQIFHCKSFEKFKVFVQLWKSHEPWILLQKLPSKAHNIEKINIMNFRS